tara:strand:- start:1098 stop:1364 length:267 start_codon:yes stop_codon:yes gene_type:complete
VYVLYGVPLGTIQSIQRTKSGGHTMSGDLKNLTLTINKITCLGELEGFANRRRVLAEQGCDVSSLAKWTSDEIKIIKTRKLEIEKGKL